MTSGRRVWQKSISTSGGETRSGLRNLSNRRPNLMGQMSVIAMVYATREPAADPRPGPTGIPCARPQLMKSAVMRK